jgi:predicted RND superfamily exporter protein
VGRTRQVTLSMNVDPGVSESGVVQALDEAVARMGLPPGVRAEPIGNAKELERSLAAFLEAIVLSLLFMYLVLAAQFESWAHPLTILASLPLIVPFAMLSLLLFGQTLNVLSLLGVLVLFGIVKKNAILQVDHALALERKGVPHLEALIAGSRQRLRPILMTTLAFVAGLAPLVVSTGAGSGTNRAIAIGVMGGQTLSLLLTLVATPVIHSVIEAARAKLARPRAHAAGGGPLTPLPLRRMAALAVVLGLVTLNSSLAVRYALGTISGQYLASTVLSVAVALSLSIAASVVTFEWAERRRLPLWRAGCSRCSRRFPS